MRRVSFTITYAIENFKYVRINAKKDENFCKVFALKNCDLESRHPCLLSPSNSDDDKDKYGFSTTSHVFGINDSTTEQFSAEVSR